MCLLSKVGLISKRASSTRILLGKLKNRTQYVHVIIENLDPTQLGRIHEIDLPLPLRPSRYHRTCSFLTACGIDVSTVGAKVCLDEIAGVTIGMRFGTVGQRLTFYGFSLSWAKCGTYHAYLDGREPTLLVNVLDILDYVGAWAPDGRRFFFLGSVVSAKRFGTLMGMYVYDESTGKTSLISGSANNVGVPSFSRDGKTMAWWEVRKTSMQAWIMEDFLPESKAGK